MRASVTCLLESLMLRKAQGGRGVEQVFLVLWPPYGKPHSVQALVRTVQEQLRREFWFKRSRFYREWSLTLYTSLFGAKFPLSYFYQIVGILLHVVTLAGQLLMRWTNKQQVERRTFSAGYNLWDFSSVLRMGNVKASSSSFQQLQTDQWLRDRRCLCEYYCLWWTSLN